jgi:transcriptional regulator with XRE-family HTH domain
VCQALRGEAHGFRSCRFDVRSPVQPESRYGQPVMPSESNSPFGEALRVLMENHGYSYRGLAEKTRQIDGRGMTHAHINMLAKGHDRPSMRAMELIAEACDVAPTYFAEYRLAQAMRELDPTEVGLESALETLNARLAGRRRAASKRQPSPTRQARTRPTG